MSQQGVAGFAGIPPLEGKNAREKSAIFYTLAENFARGGLGFASTK